jgi:exodeoxyribonuclease V gamma subunit
MTLHLHRAERTAELAGRLGELLGSTLADPFTPDVIAVPTKGVERWLAQRLSHVLGAVSGDGVCANIRFPAPTALLAEVLAHGEGDPADDPWAPARTTWPLLRIIDDSVDEPWCEALASHLEASGANPPGRRLTTAQRIARLFDIYAASRPQLLRDWADGRDTDGLGQPVPADLTWQPELWRRLREVIDTRSPAERLPESCQRLRDDPDATDLPDRISLFGPTRLTTAQLAVLSAVAAHRDVHLWLPHPSPDLWAQLESYDADNPRRHADTSSDLTRNPLLASLGRDVRELQLRLRGHAPEHTDEHLPPTAAPTESTLLGKLQAAIRDNTEPVTPEAASPDNSVQVHACHGPARQVEVLREVLVGLLEDDPTLQPRDVLVMCPNIEDYASLISATFGLADESDDNTHPGHRLRMHLADRSLRQTNPLLDLLATLIDLAGSRVNATQLLDLTALPPVRRRFRFSDDDLELLQSWTSDAKVRWGLDAEHRAPYGLSGVPNNTWRHGLDRILLGAAMTEDDLRWVDRTLPLDEVDSNDIDVAGRLAELIDRLTTVVNRLTGEHPLSHWLDTLADGIELLGDTSDADVWQRTQAVRELAEIREQAAGDHTLRLGDVQALLADRLSGRPTRANFRTGNLTMCSMMPMRSVPHRVICLLGLDDTAFPRVGAADGDDLLARDPCLGEREPRGEDRQILLDAIMAARENLVILYTGNDPRTNTARHPAVPVGEILDAVDALATYDGDAAREHVVTRHPLQPFDPSNFTVGDLGTATRPFSFDRLALAGAVRAAQPRDVGLRFVTDPLPPVAVDGDAPADVALDELIAFVEGPGRAFLRQRLAIYVRGDEGDNELPDQMSVELDALQKWDVGERMLQELIRGSRVEDYIQAEARRGTLPPGELGKQLIATVQGEVRPIFDACQPHLGTAPNTVDSIVTLEGGRRVVGTIPGVRGQTIVRATFSNLAAKHRLRAWVQLLALAASQPDRQWGAVTIGKRKDGARVATLQGLSPEDAASALAELVALRDEGLCCPLPVSPKTSAAYAEARQRFDVDASLSKATGEWAGQRFDGERGDVEHVLIYGAGASLEDALLAEPDDGAEQTKFGRLARLIWEPLLGHEGCVDL